MLSSLSTNPTNILRKFEFDKNNSHTASSNLHWTKDSNVTLGVSHERYVYENLHHNGLIPPRPHHGDPQDLLNPSLVQRYVDIDDAWNVQNDAYVALWQDAVNNHDVEQPDKVEVHWGPTDDKLTKENLTIVEGKGTFTDPFIFQS